MAKTAKTESEVKGKTTNSPKCSSKVKTKFTAASLVFSGTINNPNICNLKNYILSFSILRVRQLLKFLKATSLSEPLPKLTNSEKYYKPNDQLLIR